jgi:hypothetical protein
MYAKNLGANKIFQEVKQKIGHDGILVVNSQKK